MSAGGNASADQIVLYRILHIRNVFKERELDRAATTEESSVVQLEGQRRVRRQVVLYEDSASLRLD